VYQEKTTNITRFLVLDKRFIFNMLYIDAQILKKKLFLRFSLTFTNSSGNCMYSLHNEGKLCCMWGTNCVLWKARTPILYTCDCLSIPGFRV